MERGDELASGTHDIQRRMASREGMPEGGARAVAAGEGHDARRDDGDRKGRRGHAAHPAASSTHAAARCRTSRALS
jgi:hypothetical protein